MRRANNSQSPLFVTSLPSGTSARGFWPARMVLMSLVLVVLAACGKEEAPPDDDPKITGNTIVFPAIVKSLPGITGEAVKNGGERMLSLPGRLVWNEDRTVRVNSPFAGRVTSIMVEPGNMVKAGQVLANVASADFGVAQADARKAAADAAFANKALARQRELYNAGVVAQKELEQTQADSARSGAELARAEANLRQYGVGQAGGGQGGMNGFSLRSPINGLLVERNINPGMELRPDQTPASPLFLITDPGELWAQIDAAEATLGLFKPGAEVQLITAAYPGETFPAKVVKIADYVDPNARSIKVRLAVPNADRRLKAEMFVTARVPAARFQGLSVPAKAVFLADNRSFVFVRTGPNSFERHEVKVGVTLPESTEVVSGLTAGDVVVTEGNLYLQDILRDATAVNAARASEAKSAGKSAGKSADTSADKPAGK